MKRHILFVATRETAFLLACLTLFCLYSERGLRYAWAFLRQWWSP